MGMVPDTLVIERITTLSGAFTLLLAPCRARQLPKLAS